MSYPEHIMQAAKAIYQSVTDHINAENIYDPNRLQAEHNEILSIAATIQLVETLSYNQAIDDAVEEIKSCREPEFLRYNVSCIYEAFDMAIDHAESGVRFLKKESE